MSIPDIDQVEVNNPKAWQAAISKLRFDGHPMRGFDLLDPVPFVAYFAVHAQVKMGAGEVFADFAESLTHETQRAVGRISRSGLNLAADLLREHWKHGKHVVASCLTRQ